MRNPYAVLGVAKTADEKQIKSAFRKLAMQYHPDHNKDDKTAQAKFAELNQAYEIIGDKQKRAAFDRGEIDAEGKPAYQNFGGFGGAAGGARQGGFGGNIHIDDSILGDIFGRAGMGGGGADLFGGGRGRRGRPRKGGDVTASLAVSLADVCRGEKVEVAFSDGKRLKIKLPAYLEDGQVIRLKGQGQKAPGAEPGDALIVIRFKPEAQFRLEGRDIHCELPISLKKAALGGRETAQTPDGAVSVGIPAWTSSDKVLRLKDRGLPLKTGGRGALYIHLRVMLPREKDAQLEKWAQSAAD